MRDIPNRAEALDILRAHGRTRKFKSRQTIFARGDDGDSIAIIESGVARVSLFSADGRELALELMGAGDVAGEISAIDNRVRTADVIAVGRVTATVIPAAELRELLFSDKIVAAFFFALLCDRIRSTNAYAESHALNSLAGRLSIYFVNNGTERADGSILLENAPSQSELARLVGGARESVNRQFRVWRDAGLLVSPGDRGPTRASARAPTIAAAATSTAGPPRRRG